MTQEFDQKLLKEVQNHLVKPDHPIASIIQKFNLAFIRCYSYLVESNNDNKSELMDKIKNTGDDFCLNVFENVKKFHGALMETLIWFYDPNYKGVLDNIERDLHRVVSDKIIQS